ncbi:hypothetical protein QF035_011085 [Streptomyces umbrinus]|uniref:Integral membrane protein n=1 Tax=Streptomyces umbrinus TaxID=67370 RepID=A0ABU0TCS7_9ACTN|nr:hypothetical protein [Streptomyces umbrinus]MDQ1033503.1 hypothetical protein [Streptomyces umbrinus]
MTRSSWDRSRRLAAAACVLTVTAVVLGVLLLTVGAGVPGAWWPQTGQAFATDARPTDPDPCALIVGPAKDYCERDTTTTASARHPGISSTAWRLLPAGAGVAALVVWRRHSAAGQRRR